MEKLNIAERIEKIKKDLSLIVLSS